MRNDTRSVTSEPSARHPRTRLSATRGFRARRARLRPLFVHVDRGEAAGSRAAGVIPTPAPRAPAHAHAPTAGTDPPQADPAQRVGSPSSDQGAQHRDAGADGEESGEDRSGGRRAVEERQSTDDQADDDRRQQDQGGVLVEKRCGPGAFGGVGAGAELTCCSRGVGGWLIRLYKPMIDAVLKSDLTAPRKQRHTVKPVHDQLLDEQEAVDCTWVRHAGL